MEDNKAALIFGVVMTMGLGLVVLAVRAGTMPSAVGGTPLVNSGTSYPDERRGAGTTQYSGGSAGLGIHLGIGIGDQGGDLLPDSTGTNPRSWGRHGCKYPAASGELLEALMSGAGTWGGPGTWCPPHPKEEMQWLYAPPARMGAGGDTDG